MMPSLGVLILTSSLDPMTHKPWKTKQTLIVSAFVFVYNTYLHIFTSLIVETTGTLPYYFLHLLSSLSSSVCPALKIHKDLK